jgi:predicted ArsR family transcriptional regulator
MSNRVHLKKTKSSNGNGSWTFLTNHSHVLICLNKNPDMVLREVAYEVGITERAVQRIVQELEEAGVLQRIKLGRQNHYRINRKCKLRHKIENHRHIGELLDAIV